MDGKRIDALGMMFKSLGGYEIWGISRMKYRGVRIASSGRLCRPNGNACWDEFNFEREEKFWGFL